MTCTVALSWYEVRMTVTFERKSSAETQAREGGRKRFEGSREKQ
jgi:hypothetical protein